MKTVFRVPAAHVHTHFGNNGLHGLYIEAVDLRQIDSGDSRQMAS